MALSAQFQLLPAVAVSDFRAVQILPRIPSFTCHLSVRTTGFDGPADEMLLYRDATCISSPAHGVSSSFALHAGLLCHIAAVRILLMYISILS